MSSGATRRSAPAASRMLTARLSRSGPTLIRGSGCAAVMGAVGRPLVTPARRDASLVALRLLASVSCGGRFRRRECCTRATTSRTPSAPPIGSRASIRLPRSVNVSADGWNRRSGFMPCRVGTRQWSECRDVATPSKLVMGRRQSCDFSRAGSRDPSRHGARARRAAVRVSKSDSRSNLSPPDSSPEWQEASSRGMPSSAARLRSEVPARRSSVGTESQRRVVQPVARRQRDTSPRSDATSG
jgi:hypothetical protein